MENRSWIVHVASTITGRGQTRERVTLRPGLYTMTELTAVTYEISARGTPLARFVFSQVAAYRDSGALVIEGLWP